MERARRPVVQETEAALHDSSAKLANTTRALQAVAPVLSCVVCENQFDNKTRRIAYLDPCRHLCVSAPPVQNYLCAYLFACRGVPSTNTRRNTMAGVNLFTLYGSFLMS